MKNLISKTILCSSLLGSFYSLAARATEVAAGTANLEAVLGSAYLSEKQLFAGDRCLNGTEKVGAGKASAGFTFQNSMSENQASSQLGLSVGGRARSGAVDYSAEANFLSNSVSSALSVSSIWVSTYTFPVDKLNVSRADLNETGKSVMRHAERWASTCGDEYVAEITRGAKLFFSIRVDFKSQQEHQAFDAKFSVSGPVYGAKASLEQASEKFSRNTTVTISAHQIGGDVSKLTAIFGKQSDDKNVFVQCQLGNFENCAQVIQRALNYASDTEQGFPSQLAPGVSPGAAVLSYRTVPYTAIGIYPNNYPGLKEATKLGRQEVSNAFEKNYRYAVVANRILQGRFLGDRYASVTAEKVKVDRNLGVILKVSEICYNSPDICWTTKDEDFKALLQINEAVFLPPSFLELCENARSSAALATTIQKLRLALNSPLAESCKELGIRLAATNQLNLSGRDRPEDELDLRPLATITSLTHLVLTGSKITDLSPLGGLVNLKYLDLQTNHISDVEPISNMMDLTYLNLGHNWIEHVNNLSGLLRLQRLYLASNRIDNLKDLKFLPQLVSVDLRANPLKAEEIEGFRKAMPPTATIQF